MPYDIITSVDMTGGFHVFFLYLNSVTGGYFIPAIFFMVYVVSGLGLFYAQKRQTGNGNAPGSFAVSSFVMVGLVIFLAMIPGMVNPQLVVEVAILLVVSVLWLFFSKSSSANIV